MAARAAVVVDAGIRDGDGDMKGGGEEKKSR